MKTTKKIIAIILCIATIMSLAATSAFAADKTVEWMINSHTDYSYGRDYSYGGKVTVGENTIVPVKGDSGFAEYFYYSFEVEKAGYYSFITAQIKGNYFSGGSVAEASETGTVYDNMPIFFIDSEKYKDDIAYVYYLEEKEYYVRVELWYGDDYEIDPNSKGILDIEYYAESITDVQIDENSTKNLIYGDDIDLGALKDGRSIGTQFAYSVTFSNGKVHTTDCTYTFFKFKNEPVSGENEITLIFPGFEKDITVTAYNIEELVESVTVSNLNEACIVYKDYMGMIHEPDVANKPAVFTIKYVGGKTEEITVDDSGDFVSLWGFRTYHLSRNYIESPDGDYTFSVELAKHDFINKPCEIKEYSVSENAAVLKDNISTSLARLVRFTINALGNSVDFRNSLEDRLLYFGQSFTFIKSMGTVVFNQLKAFADYYKS